MNLHRNCDCEVHRDLRAAKRRQEEAIEDRAVLVRVVDAIACHLGVDVDAVIKDPSVAIAAHTAAIAAEMEACAAIARRFADAVEADDEYDLGRVEAFRAMDRAIRARGKSRKEAS